MICLWEDRCDIFEKHILLIDIHARAYTIEEHWNFFDNNVTQEVSDSLIDRG